MEKDKKIKVLYITHLAHLYGDNKSLLAMLCALRNRVDILVCLTRKGLMTDRLNVEGISYQLIDSVMTPVWMPENLSWKWLHKLYHYPKYLYQYVRTQHQLKKIIQSFHPDIIHSNNSVIYAGAIMSKQFHIPHVWHLREYIDKDHRRVIPDAVFFRKARAASHCIAITKGIFEHWQLQSPKDVQIYNGVFSEAELPLYHREKTPTFLFLGRIVQTKGVEDMLQAFAEFAHHNENFILQILGTGDEAYVAKLKKYIDEKQLNNRVQMLGFHQDVRPYLLSATALIVPSFFEAMGRITAEAMMLGCFVIGRNMAGTRELLERENAGILFNNTHELADAMLRVSKYSEQQLEILNCAVRHQVLHHYSAEANADGVYQFYESILEP